MGKSQIESQSQIPVFTLQVSSSKLRGKSQIFKDQISNPNN